MRRTVALAILALLAAATPALAQPSAVPAVAPVGGPGATPIATPASSDTAVAPSAEIPDPAPVASQISTPEPTPAERFVAGDPASGRAYLSPTGFTPRHGTAGVQVWAPALPIVGLAAATYAVTDRIEIGAGGFAVLDPDDGGSAGYLSAKVQLLRRRTVGVAVQVQYLAAPSAGDGSVTLLSAAASK
jgi:hypothetical protein